jgi:hypothetical protein
MHFVVHKSLLGICTKVGDIDPMAVISTIQIDDPFPFPFEHFDMPVYYSLACFAIFKKVLLVSEPIPEVSDEALVPVRCSTVVTCGDVRYIETKEEAGALYHQGSLPPSPTVEGIDPSWYTSLHQSSLRLHQPP